MQTRDKGNIFMVGHTWVIKLVICSPTHPREKALFLQGGGGGSGYDCTLVITTLAKS